MRDAGTFLDSIDKPAKRRGVWTTRFVDLSNNNGPHIDFRTIARHARTTGITCAELKATEGTTFVDPYYATWREEARQWGIRTFAYHFARPDEHPGIAGATAEAAHFCETVGKIRPGEWRPMLDFETAPLSSEWAVTWCKEVRRRLGVAPCLYSFWSAISGWPRPVGDGLILAYPNGLPRVAPVPKPWKRWTAHQYSWHGIVDGVPSQVDLNWTPSVRSLLAFPVRGAALEPVYAARRRRA